MKKAKASPAVETAPAPALEFRISSAQRIADCPGSVLASAGLPDRKSKAADSGTRIHAALSKYLSTNPFPLVVNVWNECCKSLSPDEKETAETLLNKTRWLLDSLGGQCSPAICEAKVEIGPWKGHPDFICLADDSRRLVILDWKSGWGDIPPAESNAQLRGYFAGAMESNAIAFPGIIRLDESSVLREAVVALVTPEGNPSVCTFPLADYAAAAEEMAGIAAAAMVPNAPRIPSPSACQYCRAAGTANCPESMEMALTVLRGRAVDFTQATPEWLVAVYRAGKVVSAIVKKATEEMEARLALDTSSVPGARLVDGAMVRAVTDPAGLFGRILGAGIPENRLWAGDCLKFNIGKLEKVVGKDQLPALLEGLVEVRQNKPTLEA